MDDWLLLTRESGIAVAGRILQTSAIYTRAGVRCATLAQEALQEEGPGEPE